MLTYADLLETPDDGKRYEILEGDLYVTAAPNLAHQHCVGMQIYGQYGLPHYWLVDPCARFVEAYGLVAGRYELVARACDEDELRAPPFPELAIPLAELWSS